jgi:hypothetical protein
VCIPRRMLRAIWYAQLPLAPADSSVARPAALPAALACAGAGCRSGTGGALAAAAAASLATPAVVAAAAAPDTLPAAERPRPAAAAAAALLSSEVSPSSGVVRVLSAAAPLLVAESRVDERARLLWLWRGRGDCLAEV